MKKIALIIVFIVSTFGTWQNLRFVRFMSQAYILIWICFIMTVSDVAAAVTFSLPTPLYSCGYGRGSGIFQGLDIDGDKKLDVVQYECIAFGNGDGTFRKQLLFPGQVIAAVADFTSDGKPDLVTCGFEIGLLQSCTLRTNMGNDMFNSPENVDSINNLGDWAVQNLKTADLNGDGRPDLAAILLEKGCSTSHQRLVVFPGDGNGGFGPPHTVLDLGTGAIGFGGNPMEIADLNQDGQLDIALPVRDIDLGSGQLQNYLGLYINQGGLKFTAVKIKSGATNELLDPASIKSGDVNGDGLIDLVVADGGGINDFPGFFSIFVNLGDLKFTFLKTLRGPNHPESVDLGDLDGDGKWDILSPGGTDFQLNWIHSLVSPTIAITAPTNFRSYFADMNGDGKLDIITTGYDASVSPTLVGFSVILQN